MEKPILSHLWSLKNKAKVFKNEHHAETPASPLQLSSELFYCTGRQVFDGLDLICSNSQDQNSVPLSVTCVPLFLKSKVDLHFTSLACKHWHLLAQVMVPLHSFSCGTLKGKFFPYGFLHSTWIYGMIHCSVCFKALQSATEDAVIKALPANSYLNMAGNTDLSHFNYTSNLVQYHKPEGNTKCTNWSLSIKEAFPAIWNILSTRLITYRIFGD